MAETTEQKTVLSIDTSGSVKSVKDLKQQIKDLKDRIVELTAAGEDASKEYEELGTSMRQLKDINEQAMRSSKDLGDQLAVVTGSMKGVAGAISTVTGVMGLLGAESGKTEKLMKTMVSAMSITTGIQAMESGYKAVKQLAGGFITAAKGAKTLGGAIKAAFASNPVGLLITALTTVVALLGSIVSKAKEVEKELQENLAKSAQAVKDAWNSVTASFKPDTETYSNFFSRALDSTKNELARLSAEVANSTGMMFDKNGKITEASLDSYVKYIDNFNKGYLKREQENLQAARDLRVQYYTQYGNDLEKYTQQELHQFERVWGDELAAYQNRIYRLNVENEAYLNILKNMSQADARYADYKKEQLNTYNELVAAMGAYNATLDEEEKIKKSIADKEKKDAEDAKRRREENYKTAKENAKRQLQLDKKYYDDMYATQKANAQRQLDFLRGEWDMKLRTGETSQEEYNKKMLQFELDYYNISEAYLKTYIDNIVKLQEKASKNRLLDPEDVKALYTALDVEEYGRQIEEFTRLRNDLISEYNQNVLENDHNAQELENTIETQNRINEIERESFDKRLALETEYLQKKNELHRTQYDLELALLGEEREHEMELYQAFIDENAMKMSLLNDRYANGLVTEQEFNEGMNALNQEYVERELEHSKKLVEIKRNEVEQKKELQQMYLQFEQSMTQSLSTIFTNLADLLGESNEDYKGLRIAATLLDTLQGSIAAYTGMISSIPGPLGIAAGITAATGVILQGMNTIKQMNKVDAKNGATSTSTVAMQTFTTPQTATIATGMSNDYTDMLGNSIGNAQQNQRVYVVLNDINEAQGRRVQVVNSNTY